MEQVTGLEPVISAWKANVLPLHYTCLIVNGAGNGVRTRHLSLGKAALYQMSYSRGYAAPTRGGNLVPPQGFEPWTP